MRPQSLPGVASLPRPPSCAGRQNGAIVVMFATVIMLCLGLMAFALDLSRIYNRRAELQGIADVAAVAAANKLSGSANGIDEASSAAAAAVAALQYQYNQQPVIWNNGALSFSSDPDSNSWQSVSDARLAAGSANFVRVDTTALGPELGAVDTLFAKLLAAKFDPVNISATAVAGRSSLKVTPLAICAMSTVAAASRDTKAELVQFGFRRGVGYDLMDLNPNGSEPVSFIVNPIDGEGKPSNPVNTSVGIVGPFVCSGTMPMRRLVGRRVQVQASFPIDKLFQHLNSRFDQYVGGYCNFRSAPPDANIKPYPAATAAEWMKQKPGQQTAQRVDTTTRRSTIADLAVDELPTGTKAVNFGTMWSFARPVPFSAYSSSNPEPAEGYVPFAPSAWASLYSVADLEPKADYPLPNPYRTNKYSTAPQATRGKGILYRRVLNIPLLECPVDPAGQAKVLAIGRFFMTVPATATSLSAEFAGIADEASIGGSVELYQ